ncbi:hypothetical protein QA634_07350 [Methylobacterium sp. CB376]|uniref:hypothetical protein n=1 Tax=unclassified Methylobacterium TaxID=2615210 RepID=UPI002240D4D8|nr:MULTISPECIES: hypothetical protein [Methylobacterium]WFT81679.1 hypothetical protein QA634_07350 [Methylobacterium nodulans]
MCDGRGTGRLAADARADLTSGCGASGETSETAVRTARRRRAEVRPTRAANPHQGPSAEAVRRPVGERSGPDVTADQRGCPTLAANLAAILARIAPPQPPHLA